MLRKVAWARLKQAVAAFASCEGGNIAMIFSMTLVPTIFLAGAAVDYSGASNLRTKLQRATDGANMQLCLMPVNSTQTQLEQAARTAMAGYMGDRPFRVVSVVPTTKPRQVLLTTSADFQTAIVRAVNANFATVPVNASATCFAEQQTFEIALVLDNTGSMNNSAGGLSKMQAMRTAATNFVNTIFSDPMMVGHTKMSLVPFAATVAVNPSTYRNASWIDQNGKAANHWSFVQGGAATVSGFASFGVKSRLDVYNHLKSFVPSWDWNGCFESLPYPLNTQDGAPATNNKDSYYVPIFAPDESGDGAQYQHDTNGVTVYSLNSYMNDTAASPLPHPLPACTTASDEATKTGQACKYVQPNNVKTSMVVPYLGTIPIGPNTSCTTRPLTRMTATASTLTSEISALTAQQQAKTNIHEGFMWGWRTISPISVFADGAPYTKEFNHKIIILMTDGTNTWTSNSHNPTLKSTYSAYGFFKNPDGSTANTRVPIANPTTDADSRAAIDALTLESCKKARDAGVKIFTIGFSVTGDTIDQKGLKLLSDCAANSKQSFVAHNSSDIDSVLQEIAQSIGRLRLSM